MPDKKSKVTYDYQRRNILLLKMAYRIGDFKSFNSLLSELPRQCSVTIVTDEQGKEELFVNLPAKPKD